jgi:squalene-associated FAD-dependent desaturase
VLSGNRATLAFLATIGAADRLVGPPAAAVDFADLATGERWTLRPNDGRIPWWVFDPKRRVPGTRALDYLPAARLLRAPPQQRIDAALTCKGTLYDRLLHPFLLAALNTDPREASAGLAGRVIRETLAAGGAACRPLIARDGLGPTFIEPALRFLQQHGGTLHFGHRLRAIGATDAADVVHSLTLGDEDPLHLGPADAVILAVPPPVAAALVPGLPVPSEFRAIVNAHYRIAPPAEFPPMIGVINGLAEWVFAFPDRLSVTISGADRLLDTPREELAALIWSDIKQLAGFPEPMPPWQIVRERRATFAATPEQNALRPGPQTRWRNLALAGDWTATGLPATIEGAIRSGNQAAETLAATFA